jgi:hypothetical protein
VPNWKKTLTADKTKKGAALKRTKNKGASNDGDDCKYGNFDIGIPTAQAVSAKLKGDKTKKDAALKRTKNKGAPNDSVTWSLSNSAKPIIENTAEINIVGEGTTDVDGISSICSGDNINVNTPNKKMRFTEDKGSETFPLTGNIDPLNAWGVSSYLCIFNIQHQTYPMCT